jgi:hypothetical protein
MTSVIDGYCTLCRSRCGTLNTVDSDQMLSVEPDPSHPTRKAMCMKGRAAPQIVHSPHRVFYPMRRTTTKGAKSPGWNLILPIGNYFGVIADTGPAPVNFRDIHPRVLTDSGHGVTVSTAWIFYWRQSLQDGVCSVPGTLIRASGNSNARFVGQRPRIGAADGGTAARKSISFFAVAFWKKQDLRWTAKQKFCAQEVSRSSHL